MVDRLRVAVLGATGLVGQRFVARLARHPWFELEALYASPESAGKRYGEAVEWVVDEEPPLEFWDERLKTIDVDDIVRGRYDIVFSALPSEAAGVEVELARQGARIVSNASPMRMDPDIPLLNPEANAEHARLVELQSKTRGWRGWIAKVPNCTTAILTLPLKPLHDEYRVRRVMVVTMQAVSGAGLRGVPSMFIIDNLIPFIAGEEEKVARESRKILGKYTGQGVAEADFQVTATTTRVPVLEGHTEAVFVELEKLPGDAKEVARVLEEYKGSQVRNLNLPTAPPKPVTVLWEEDRPQPRLDRNTGNGMTVVVGRLRVDPVVHGVRMIVLGHNTVRGAAGNGILIAELMHKLGYTT